MDEKTAREVSAMLTETWASQNKARIARAVAAGKLSG
jgi:hypothetical protein